MSDARAVILAGGRGTRFWPVSNSSMPKQFLDITGRGSMIGLTFERLGRFVRPGNIYVLTVAGMERSIRDMLPDIPESNIFAEPVGRNTAPSLAVAAQIAARDGDDSPLICCPADHVIGEEARFEQLALAAADLAARRDVLVTFGIDPAYAATGYGYIEAGDLETESNGCSFHRVVSFHEKPDIERAKEYLAAGSFYWNSGIFVWRPSVLLTAWRRYVPEGVEPLERISASLGTPAEGETVEAAYPLMPSISVDYAILEKAENVLVAPADLAWNDVGSWDALFELLPDDGSGNIGSGYVKQVGSRGNLFFNPGGVTAAIGVEDMIVVVNGGTVLICKRGESQRVRDLVSELEKDGRDDLL